MNKFWKGLLIISWGLFPSSGAIAATSNWTGLVNSDFSTAGNWDSGVPADDAGFNAVAQTAISNSIFATLNSLTFHVGASAYTLTNFQSFTLLGTGITNNSSQLQTLVNSQNATLINFKNASTAGNAVLNNAFGEILFSNNSSASNSTITNTNNGQIVFNDFSTAANATLINSAGLTFTAFATADHATITNLAGAALGVGNFATADHATILNRAGATIQINDNGTLGSATVFNEGTLDATQRAGLSFAVGSISGPGDFLLGTQQMIVGSNDLSTTVTGNISGVSGSLTKVGNGTLTLAGTNSYTGATTISGGVLDLQSSLSGNVTVNGLGTLSGAGTIGNLVNNGTVAAGTANVGTLIASSYSGTGTLLSNFNGASHGSVRVNGNASINGETLQVTGSNFAVGRYSVLNASTLTGTFSAFSSPVSSLLSFAPAYTATDAYVTINFTTPFATFAQTSNQRQVASNLSEQKAASSGEFTSAINLIAGLPTSQIPSAYDQISGDVLPTFQSLALQNAAQFSHGIHDRSVGVSSSTFGLWAQALGWNQWVKEDSDVGSPASNALAGGFQAGYDTFLTDNLLFGFTGGYAHTGLSVHDRDSSGGVNAVDSGIYARHMSGPWLTHGAFNYITASNSLDRTIRYPGIDELAKSSFNSRLYVTNIETRYVIQHDQRTTLEPTFALRQSHLKQDGFAETGASGLGLTVGDRTLNSWVSSVGAGLGKRLGMSDVYPLQLRIHAAWEHEWATTQNKLLAHFTDVNGGSDFTVQSTPRSRNALALGVEAQKPLRDSLELFTSYTLDVGIRVLAQKLFGGIRWMW